MRRGRGAASSIAMGLIERSIVLVILVLAGAGIAASPAFGARSSAATQPADADDRPPGPCPRQLLRRRPQGLARRLGRDQRAHPTGRAPGRVPAPLRAGGSGVCLPYDGPPLAWLVKACKAPDGSYWALQTWQRLKPNYGGTTGAWELHLSHWRGATPSSSSTRTGRTAVSATSSAGSPTTGGRVRFSATPHGNPLDGYGRNIYVDTSTRPTARAGIARTASSPTTAATRSATSVTASTRAAIRAETGPSTAQPSKAPASRPT